MPAQINILDEIIVDNFAGGGGASTGIELATGRPVTIAINHDPAAILMHRTNHPYTEHLQASVWDVDPVEVCAGRPVGLAWFSPDCKHFSKAKGSALVDRNIRGLAWIVLRWAGTVRPRVIILENVEEFQTWGPVRKGKPIKKKSGQTFRKWLAQLKDLGYDVEYRELVAADYGAPTTRKRFVLVARCDGQPIRWPERTHAPKDSPEVKTGKLKPWRSAAEIIDWSVPMYSIFASKQEIKERYGVNAVRPLADNTLRRIIRGVDKFTIKSGKPFIVPTGYGERKGQAPRVHDIDNPLPTVVSTCKQNLARPAIAPVTFSNTCNSVGSPADQPVHTVTSAGNQILSAAHLAQYHTEQTENVRGSGLEGPLPTVDGSNRHALVTAQLAEFYGNGQPIDIEAPMRTVTSHDRECLACAHLDKYYAGGYSGAGNSMDEPVTTITVEPRQSLIAAHMQKYYGGVIGSEASDPLPTVTSIDHNALTAAHVVKFKGQNLGQHPEEPLQTVTATVGQFAACGVRIVRYGPGAELGYWPQVRTLLNQYCGYSLADDEVLLLRICGAWHYIRDITMRMLIPRELYAAMGFPPDYIIDRDYTGKAYPKSEQVARCGNAVCPPMATAVVKANLPEWSSVTYYTMSALTGAIAI